MKIALSIVIAGLMIAGAILYSEKNGNTQAVHNVQMVDGKQVITITAKGTYSPRFTTAKAGVPTVIKMATRGTFDCTAALTIPSLSYEKNLPPSGETLIDVPPQKAGTTLRGVCAMGMYNFSIAFN